MVPPIHSLSLVHSLTRKLRFRRIHLQPVQTCQVTCAEQRLAHPFGPLSACPLVVMSQVLQHVEVASLFVDPMCHMQLATVISSSPGTTLWVGPVLSQAFPARFPYLAKSACNTFSSSFYCSVIYVPLNRCHLYVSWEVNVILTPFSEIYVYLGRPDMPECNVTTELCTTPSSKRMGRIQYFFCWFSAEYFPLFPPKAKWTCMTYTY